MAEFKFGDQGFEPRVQGYGYRGCFKLPVGLGFRVVANYLDLLGAFSGLWCRLLKHN